MWSKLQCKFLLLCLPLKWHFTQFSSKDVNLHLRQYEPRQDMFTYVLYLVEYKADSNIDQNALFVFSEYCFDLVGARCCMISHY